MQNVLTEVFNLDQTFSKGFVKDVEHVCLECIYWLGTGASTPGTTMITCDQIVISKIKIVICHFLSA